MNWMEELKVEFRENRADAMILLIWESSSQRREVIGRVHLFSSLVRISQSPFSIHPVSAKPSETRDCFLEIRVWDSLHVFWSYPLDDGGDDIEYFRIEYWERPIFDINRIFERSFISRELHGEVLMLAYGDEKKAIPFEVGESPDVIELLMRTLTNVKNLHVSLEEDLDVLKYNII